MLDTDIFIGVKLKKISESISSQIAKLLIQQNVEFEPRAFPVLLVLKEKESVNINEIAAILGMTHPAIVQIANHLNKVGFIKHNKSMIDKRITLLELTEKGEENLTLLEPLIVGIRDTIKSIIKEVDINLIYSISKLSKAIGNNILMNRVLDDLRQKALTEISVVPFKRKYKSDFIRINREWLKKYFEDEGFEKEDERLLKNPEKEIINKGGEIFFAILNNEVVGTCAVIKIDDLSFELAKMGVTEKAQGKQIGKKLALTSIGYAVEKGAVKLTLCTSIKLIAALNLYKKLGFKEKTKKDDRRYKRALIHMELDLSG
ncbi:MAG: hypothetical protein BMS9Abin39_0728 [Ignavibacteria bacterium]|nr:MAG: hypothetical protein BMS9Abin39_0728 [Ignavibacteria bacterium]